MFIDQIAPAIAGAYHAALDGISKAIAGAWGAGQLNDIDAETAFALIEARRDQLRSPSQLALGTGMTVGAKRQPLPRNRFPEPLYQSARRHPERMARRRQLASSGPLPPALAAHFTTSQLAVLAIVADEAGADRACMLCLDAIAARAGVCRSTARAALRLAERHKLITREERRRPGRASLTTVLRVASSEWRLWIAHGGRRAQRHRVALFGRLFDDRGGVKKTLRTDRLRQKTSLNLEASNSAPRETRYQISSR